MMGLEIDFEFLKMEQNWVRGFKNGNLAKLTHGKAYSLNLPPDALEPDATGYYNDNTLIFFIKKKNQMCNSKSDLHEI